MFFRFFVFSWFKVSRPALDYNAADFVFLIDGSSSMQANIDAVRQGMPVFVDQIAAKKTDAMYSVVVFALEPEVVLDWTPSALLARDVIKQVIAGNGNYFTRDPKNVVHFDHDCKHTNNCGTREASFEALRMVLGKAANNTFARHPESQTAKEFGKGLPFRPGAERYVFLVTDEDNDCPFHDVNRYFDGPTQQCTTPGFVVSDNDGTYQPTRFFTNNAAWPTVPNPWQKEVVATARAIYDSRAHVSIFCNPANGRTLPQFGNPALAFQAMNADFSNFSAPQTLSRLVAGNFSRSLQALTLELQLADSAVADDMRLFDVRNITSPNVVDNFFKEVAKTIVSACFGKKRQQANCQLNYCDIDGDKKCRSDPRCDATSLQCDNCRIPGPSNTTLCVFDGAANPRNRCQICSYYRSVAARTAWSDGCDDRDDCTEDSCVVDPISGANKCQYKDLCTPQCGRCLIQAKSGVRCVGFGEISDTNPCEQCDPLNGEPTAASCAAGNFTSANECQSFNWWSPIVPPPVGKMCKQSSCKLGTLGCDCLDGFCASPAANGSEVICSATACVLAPPITPAPITPAPPACSDARRGELDCKCFTNGTCASPAVVFCLDQDKATEQCILCNGCGPPAGSVGFPCRPSNHPYFAAVGECDGALSCVFGICTARTPAPTPAPTCAPGTVDCACGANGTCINSAAVAGLADELLCSGPAGARQCRPRGCAVGKLNCGCATAATSSNGTTTAPCEGELQCDATTNRCRNCKAGELFCECLADLTCQGALACTQERRCIDTCTLPGAQKCCTAKAPGCLCSGRNECDSGLVCSNFGLCKPADAVEDPCAGACRAKVGECEFGPLMCSCNANGVVNVVCRTKPITDAPSTDGEVITAAVSLHVPLAALLLLLLATL
jgi:hypothetical protein